MATYEHWTAAYSRILAEVKDEHPDWDERAVYLEYKERCKAWKAERGIR